MKSFFLFVAGLFLAFGYARALDAQVQLPEVVWEKTFGENVGPGRCVLQTKDKGYIILAATPYTNINKSGIYLLKTDSFGNSIWLKEYGKKEDDINGMSVIISSDTGYVVSGYRYSPGKNHQVYLFKTDDFGDLVWEKTFGEIYDEYGNSVIEASDGNYFELRNSLNPHKSV